MQTNWFQFNNVFYGVGIKPEQPPRELHPQNTVRILLGMGMSEQQYEKAEISGFPLLFLLPEAESLEPYFHLTLLYYTLTTPVMEEDS